MIRELLADVSDLSGQVEALKRRLFGKRSEKIDSDQMLLFDRLVDEALAEREKSREEDSQRETILYTRKKPTGRKPLPEHLPRKRIDYHPDTTDLTCSECNGQKSRIGEETSEQLEYIPASMFVIQHVRHKYACKSCSGNVCIAKVPSKAMDRGLPGYGLLAHIAVSKYADHLPLHRLEGIFRRHRVEIARSTMCGWIATVSDLLSPIVKELKHQVLQSRRIHTDDTRVPVQDRDRSSTRNGYLWVYVGEAGDVVYDYTPTRNRAGPLRFLGDYSGFVQADAFAGYDEYFDTSDATEVACWAHARRKFYDARLDDGRRCRPMLALIGQLYDVERDGKDLDEDARLALRRERSLPVLAEIHEKLTRWSVEVLPRSAVGKAVQYALGLWPALTVYADHGHLAIDNNPAERALRGVVVGRKNWLFAGSDEGGRRAAVIYSIIESCKQAGVEPYAYIRDVLTRVDTHPASDAESLVPRLWHSLDIS